jgi:hypothetical protein
MACRIAPALLGLAASLAAATPAGAQGIAPLERRFADGTTVLVYGQIDKCVLHYDDGAATETYAGIDNYNSGTRAGLIYRRDRGAWRFENLNEIQYAPFSTATASILDPRPASGDRAFTNADIRKLDFSLAHARHGRVWLGQGSMATDGITELDLSGTAVVAYSSVGDSASGQLLRLSDGLLADPGITIGDAFSNYDGDRRVRARYDTPAFRGFTLAAAFGRDLLGDTAADRQRNLTDAALRYAGTLGTLELRAGIGYGWQEDAATLWSGSVSALHRPTGLSLTLAAARHAADDGVDGRYAYAKLGLERDLVAWGATAVSLDGYDGTDIFADPGSGITGSTSASWGVAVVQAIDRINPELWLTGRGYRTADDDARYDDGRAVFAGARFRF